jgi:hypothetical protein
MYELHYAPKISMDLPAYIPEELLTRQQKQKQHRKIIAENYKKVLLGKKCKS